MKSAVAGWQRSVRIFRYPPGWIFFDVGTGTGYFAILLALHGHRTTGIDFTRAMLQEAEETADSYAANASFLYMDAQALDFPDNSFDAIVTRNLTWTIPEPEKAYQEWAPGSSSRRHPAEL